MRRNDILFGLLRTGLETDTQMGEVFCDLSIPISVDVAFAAKQGVAAFVYDGLQRLIKGGTVSKEAIPKEVKMKLFSYAMQVERVHWHHKRVIAKLAEFYAEHGIRMMVLKGYGLSLLYPHPNHRPCGDIDIWLFGEQERADKLLHEKVGVKIDYGHQHHTVFTIDGVMVENHFEFVNVLSYRSNLLVEQELRKAVRDGELIKDERIDNVYYPPVKFNVLFLLRHTAGHFVTSETVLRHVADWAMFVKHYHEEINWEWLESIAKEQNMHNFLHCLNAICIDYFGLMPDMFPHVGRNEGLEARIMADILHPTFPERGDLRKCWWKNYAYTLRRWWGNRWKHRIVYREGLLMSFLVLLTSHYRTKPKMGKA